LLFTLFSIFTMTDLNNKVAALEAKISRWEDQLEGASEEREKDRLANLISSTRGTLNILLAQQQSAPGKPPPSTSLLSSSSFHPLFDFIFLFNSHAILSLLGFSFPVIYL
jgi:hypothetical protein